MRERASHRPTSDGGAASECEAPDLQRDMAQQLFLDEDFHLYICGRLVWPFLFFALIEACA